MISTMGIRTTEAPSQETGFSKFLNSREPKLILARAGLYLATSVPAAVSTLYGLGLILPHESPAQTQLDSLDSSIREIKADYQSSRDPMERAVINERFHLMTEDRRPVLAQVDRETSPRRAVGALSLLFILGSFMMRKPFITGKRYNDVGKLE